MNIFLNEQFLSNTLIRKNWHARTSHSLTWPNQKKEKNLNFSCLAKFYSTQST